LNPGLAKRRVGQSPGPAKACYHSPVDCPRCGETAVTDPVCPRCGVVFAKLRERPPRPATSVVAKPPPREATSGSPWTVVLIGVLAIAALALWRLRPPAPRAAEPRAATAPSTTMAPAEVMVEAPPPEASPIPPPPAVIPSGALTPEDARAASSLLQRLALRVPLSAADIADIETLYRRYPTQAGLRDLFTSALVTVANQDRLARRYDTAAAALRRAGDLRPGDVALQLSLANLHLEAAEWSAAEAAARQALQIEARNPDALEALAFALFRQDRNREARDALRAALDVRPSASAEALLARIEKGLADEDGMTEQRLAHFDVRYDGEAHADVGREILRGLERHYATLVGSFDHQPTATIPVILFTQQAYYDAAGAPAWSGGVYDNSDGRIRIPIMGVTAALTPEMDGTLIHELTHAFIFDISRGVAPRNLHEGVAQYMEGKRLASMLEPEQLTALADGRVRGVAGFYLSALSFAEYLFATRGQGGLNDALRVMGETGNLDESFRRVYGQDYNATERLWMDRFRQQYGS
jgi:tetratricopeptide (TPR) repeat protein